MARYSVNNYSVETLLSNIKSGSIAIPEMQRPFVWDSSKVRDLVDSLYKGFPVGYIIVWQNPDVKLKDGTKSSGKKVLIDGQQRITAMAAAIVGQEVLDDHYKWKRISIAFNPLEEKFEVANNAILKSSKWIPDIAPVLEPAFDTFSFVMDYCQKNEITDQMSQVNNIVNRLRGILWMLWFVWNIEYPEWSEGNWRMCFPRVRRADGNVKSPEGSHLHWRRSL